MDQLCLISFFKSLNFINHQTWAPSIGEAFLIHLLKRWKSTIKCQREVSITWYWLQVLGSQSGMSHSIHNICQMVLSLSTLTIQMSTNKSKWFLKRWKSLESQELKEPTIYSGLMLTRKTCSSGWHFGTMVAFGWTPKWVSNNKSPIGLISKTMSLLFAAHQIWWLTMLW